MIIWCTGLSGSGKTTICNLLKNKLTTDGYSVEWYDGDRVRAELKIESDFSKDGILKNNMTVIDKINSMKDNVDFILISLITPFREVRKYAREIFGNKYFEVYIKCDRQTLIDRDTKGLYAKALNGEIDNLIGFSDKIPYEEPTNPDLVIESDQLSPEESVQKIYDTLSIRA